MSQNINSGNFLDEFFKNLKGFSGKTSKDREKNDGDSYSKALERIRKIKEEAEEKERESERRKLEEEQKIIEEREREQRREHVEEVTCMDLPLDWNNPFNNDKRAEGIHIESISDALIKSLATLGKADIEFIASVTGNDYKTVITALKGSIYQNPATWNECFYKGWETADEYLSGNLMEKLNKAVEENEKYNGYFSDNIKAIKAVLPSGIAHEEIYITLGTPWVPEEVIEDFIVFLFGNPKINRYYYNKRYCKVRHDDITGTWEISDKWLYRNEVSTTSTYGTSKLNAIYLLEKTLNLRPIVVNDISRTTNKKSINKPETALLLEKQKKLIKAFQDWVWTDAERKEKLEAVYANQYSCVKKRIFDGSFLEFPGLSPLVELYPYQKNAVARIIFTPNTLLAHDVGAGKTYIMIAAGMELKRMGLSEKNFYVVPNNVQNQWVDIFNVMYPRAKILTVNKNNFSPAKREETLKKMRDSDYDAVIITYSSFELIPLSKYYYEEELSSRVDEINEIIEKTGKATSALRKRRDNLKKKLSELVVAMEENSDVICFDDLGVTRLFVDEAHNFKNVPLKTKMGSIMGISTSGSKRCQDMMDKVHLVQKRNGGRGVVFATGTPITNSVTDAYIMQQYLQSGELAGVDLQNFDSWVAMFAEKKQEFEVDVDTTKYRLATRFSKFHNLPELTALFSSVADFYNVDNDGLPAFGGYITSTISKSDDFEEFLQEISARADAVRAGFVKRTDDNMLKITTDGRKAALDLRLIDSNRYPFTVNSKVVRCAENAYEIYLRTKSKKLTQIIFCDTSTPKDGFNIYDELKLVLKSFGVPEGEIAFIHDAESAKKRQQLFSRFNSGEIRILIGSTFKLGLGVNVQERLYAVHHLDVPWRPSDMTQREGRILRQGNTNPEVKIFRYITEGSFDAYSWQLLETKQRFITDLLSGAVTERSASEIDDVVLDYAEVKAIAIGNPLIKERVETANELNRLIALQHKNIENQIRLEQELAEIPVKIKNQKKHIKNCTLDIDNTAEKSEELSREERIAIRESVHCALKDNVLQIHENVLMNYRGFEVVLPANMTADKPYVWIQKKGRYFVELGDNAAGNLIRIDNCIDNLPHHLLKLRKNLSILLERTAAIEAELSKKEDYAASIENKKRKLKAIDDKLGVNEDE